MSAIKIIKIDLPIDGVKVKNIEEIRDHFTVEIVDHYRSGALSKWLRSRNYKDELECVKSLDGSADSCCLMESLCRIFNIDVDSDVIKLAVADVEKYDSGNISDMAKAYFHLADVIDNAIYYSIRMNVLSHHADGVFFDIYAQPNKYFDYGESYRLADNDNPFASGCYDSNIYSGSSRKLVKYDAYGWYLCSGDFKDYAKNAYLFKSMQQKRKEMIIRVAENIEMSILKKVLIDRASELEKLIEKIPDKKEVEMPATFFDCDVALISRPLDAEVLNMEKMSREELTLIISSKSKWSW